MEGDTTSLCFGGQPASMQCVAPGEFDGSVLRRDGPRGVLFKADWCGYCRAFEQQYAAAAAVDPAHLLVADLSDWDDPRWDDLDIVVVPTLVLFVGGTEVWRVDGVLGRGLRPDDLQALRARIAAA